MSLPSVEVFEEALLAEISVKNLRVARNIGLATMKFPDFWNASEFGGALQRSSLARISERDDIQCFGNFKTRGFEKCDALSRDTKELKTYSALRNCSSVKLEIMRNG